MGEARQAADYLRRANIVVGIPGGRDAGAVRATMHAAAHGLWRYFPHETAAIAAGGADTGLSHAGGESLERRYPCLHMGTRAGSADIARSRDFRLIFELAEAVHARAVVILDPESGIAATENVEALLRPVLLGSYDLAAPRYPGGPCEGLIPALFLYPLGRALYGAFPRNPAGPDFGASARLARRLAAFEWDTGAGPVWPEIAASTAAAAEGFRVAETCLERRPAPRYGAREAMERAAAASFALMARYESVWPRRTSGDAMEVFGQPEPAARGGSEDAPAGRWEEAFRTAREEMGPVWAEILDPETAARVRGGGSGAMWMTDGLWARLVFEFALAHRQRAFTGSWIPAAIAPLYLARAAAFARACEADSDVEERIERGRAMFEAVKPGAAARWPGCTAAPMRRGFGGMQTTED